MEFRLLTPAKLAQQARFFGLEQRGKKQLWVMRKSITDPRTGKERPLKRSTKTNDLQRAVYRASTWWDEHVERILGSRLPTIPSQRAWATLQQIEEHYKRAATCDTATRNKNWNCLTAMISAMQPDAEVGSLSSEVLDGRFVRQWQLKMKEAAEKAHLPKDIEACERAKRGANACYRKARSIFAKAMFRSYEDAGLRLPATVREFPEQGFLKAAAPPPSEQLTAETVAKIWRLMPRLKEVRPTTWAVVLLMWRAGLRNKEVFHARWSWVLKDEQGGYVLDLRTRGDFTSKTRSDDIVQVAPALISELESVRRAADKENDEAFLVPAASEAERRYVCYKGVGKFLRACGVAKVKDKLAYRLRGDAITTIWLSHGARAAQALARHKSARTTEIYRGARVPYAPLALPGS